MMSTKAHCKCFQMWAVQYNGTAIGTVRCGYCRTPFPEKELCFLCLKNKEKGQDYIKPAAVEQQFTNTVLKYCKKHSPGWCSNSHWNVAEQRIVDASGTNFKNLIIVNSCKKFFMLINYFQMFIVVNTPFWKFTFSLLPVFYDYSGTAYQLLPPLY
jgi:hypothetical protein